jgi:hypothetical protein
MYDLFRVELILGVPGLIVWQLVEGRRAWRKSSVRSAQEFGERSPVKLGTKLR